MRSWWGVPGAEAIGIWLQCVQKGESQAGGGLRYGQSLQAVQVTSRRKCGVWTDPGQLCMDVQLLLSKAECG